MVRKMPASTFLPSRELRVLNSSSITHFSNAGTTAANRARLLTGHCTSGATITLNQTNAMKTTVTKVRRETETE
jgi:hypothetical protein